MQDNFITIYQSEIRQNNYQPDGSQEALVEQLDSIWQTHSLNTPVWQRHSKPKQSLYIWGDVGRGKTFLMDLLFRNLPEDKTLRLHFHRFMQNVHRLLRLHQGKSDPLTTIADDLAEQYSLICFDEFYMDDIADVMIISKLVTSLFERKVTLITTSNRPPEKLCKDPLFQDRVRPIIRTIHEQMRIFNLAGECDYRLRQLTKAECFFLHNADTLLTETFQALTGLPPLAGEIDILNRPMAVLGIADQCVWFDFYELCAGPRSQLDYIDLANRFSQVIISDIPPMGGKPVEQIKARGTEDGSSRVIAGDRQVMLGRMDDPARRFISLVDEFYDRGVKLYLGLDVPLEQLYLQGNLAFEFSRTLSRLTEMQSLEYLQLPHQGEETGDSPLSTT